MSTETRPTPRPLIDRHGPDGFQIAGGIYRSAVLILPSGVMEWAIGGLDDIDVGSLQPIIRHGAIDLILIGTGRTLTRPKNLSRAALKVGGIGFDPMDSASACRTYNILALEGRRVAAALLPIRYQAATQL